MKLYEMPKNSKLYIEDKIIIFDHLDGLYSYCYALEDKNKIINISAYTEFVKYKDGYKIKGDRKRGKNET